MKPDWDYSPHWATHLAQDDDSTWHWFSEMPSYHKGRWTVQFGGYFEKAYPRGEHTVEARP